MSTRRTNPSRALLYGLRLALVGLLAAGIWSTGSVNWPHHPAGANEAVSNQDRVPIPPNILNSATDWINTGAPIHLGDLKGKIVLLDFWTFCCINCHHVLPDLEYLEKKYPNELVVIGIHTPKFDGEKSTANVRKKVNEYRIRHPVANDADQTIWRSFGVNSWPTLVLIDARGNLVGKAPGEGNREVVEQAIVKLIEEHRARKELNETPYVFVPEMDKNDDGPLLFPGKVLADAPGNRLFISDTGHNRIVVTDLEGKKIAVAGNGEAKLKDGSFEEASFNRQQGMCLVGDTLYVADTENHAIRALDLQKRTVATVAGTGEQTYHRSMGSGSTKSFGMNSPWDIVQVPGKNQFIIAMAGPHQLWKLDLDRNHVEIWSGTSRENIVDGPARSANFAQPSGLATDGTFVYVADSEVSGIRKVSLKDGSVETLIGTGLFDFGDREGKFDRTLLQHCLGVSYQDGQLFIADTYNNKVKVCYLAQNKCETLVGTTAPGHTDAPPRFYQPGGLSVTGDRLFVADTNNNAIRVVNLGDRSVKTLALADVSAPVPTRKPPTFPFADLIEHPPVEVAAGPEVALEVKLDLPKGYKLSPDAPLPYVIDASSSDLLAESITPLGDRVAEPSTSFTVRIPFAKPLEDGQKFDLKLSVAALICQGEKGLCRPKSYIWTVPVTVGKDGKGTIPLETKKEGKG